MLDELLAAKRPPPFRELWRAADWIGSLTFLQLQECDEEVAVWLHFPEEIRAAAPFRAVERADLCWQLLLRAECGLALCKDRILDRKKFDWSQPPATVYRHLLIDLWRSDATYWALHQFGTSKGDAIRATESRIGQACARVQPERN